MLKEKKVYVKELAKRLYASEPSIHRNLANLERQSLLKQVHGGAILEESNNADTRIPFILRELEQSNAKIVMAQKAAELVRDRNIVTLDASSSAYSLIPLLSRKSQITVITSGVKALNRLVEYHIPAFSTGGELLHSCFSLVGDGVRRMFSHYNADIRFFSCRGLDLDGTVTDFSIEENIVRQKMMEKFAKKLLLSDSGKIGKKFIHNLCSLRELDAVISETELPPQLAEMIH